MTQPKRVFDFGKNWQTFVADALNDERRAEARNSLTAFCGGDSYIQGKSFVDVGSGSGLFSWAAHTLGASRVVSFDINPRSAACTRYLWELAGKPASWEILEGSVLDKTFVRELGEFDFVYSWGVLHHTGSMWQALSLACGLCKPGGFFYLALYNKADGFAFYPDGRFGPSSFWALEKAWYVRLPAWTQAAVSSLVMGLMIIVYSLTLQNPIRKIRNHKKLRGMAWSVDIRDWLGGYPYEYAKADEVFRVMKEKNFSLENLHCNNGLLNNEFLFYKKTPPVS